MHIKNVSVMILEIEKVSDTSAVVRYELEGKVIERPVSLNQARTMRVGSYFLVPIDLVEKKEDVKVVRDEYVQEEMHD